MQPNDHLTREDLEWLHASGIRHDHERPAYPLGLWLLIVAFRVWMGVCRAIGWCYRCFVGYEWPFQVLLSFVALFVIAMMVGRG